MNRISARQPFVPGLVDSDEDLPATGSALDAWTIFASVVVAIGVALLVWVTTH